MQIEYPPLPDELELNSSTAQYYRAIESSYVPPSPPLSESQWMLGTGSKYQTAIVVLSKDIEDPEADIIVSNLRVLEQQVCICRNLALWDSKFWIAETACKGLSGITKAMFWPLNTFKSRTVIYETIAELTKQQIPWMMLFRKV